VRSPAKTVAGIVLLAVTVASALAALHLRDELLRAGLAEGAGAGNVRVTVLDPDGRALFNGTVHLENGTVLLALDAAARAGNFTYGVREYDMGAYVHEIGGHEARGAHGWKYWVQRDGGWSLGDRSAQWYPVRDGDWVLWRWGTLDDSEPFGPQGP